MSRLLTFVLAVCLISAGPAAVSLPPVITVTHGSGGLCVPGNFGGGNPFGFGTFGPNYGACGFTGGSFGLVNGSPFPIYGANPCFGGNPYGFGTFGPNYGACGFTGGPIGLNCGTPFTNWNCNPCFGVGGFPCWAGNICSPAFGGLCGPNFAGGCWPGNALGVGCRFGFGGAGCTLLTGRGYGQGTVNFNQFSRNNSISYVPWYDQGYGVAGSWGMSSFGCGLPNQTAGGMMVSVNDFVAAAPARPRSQMIEFPAPLAEGTALIRVEAPAGAEVTVQGRQLTGKGSTRVFVTPALKGPTPFDIQLTTTNDGKPAKQALTVTVAPGDHRQVMFLR